MLSDRPGLVSVLLPVTQELQEHMASLMNLLPPSLPCLLPSFRSPLSISSLSTSLTFFNPKMPGSSFSSPLSLSRLLFPHLKQPAEVEGIMCELNVGNTCVMCHGVPVQ